MQKLRPMLHCKLLSNNAPLTAAAEAERRARTSKVELRCSCYNPPITAANRLSIINKVPNIHLTAAAKAKRRSAASKVHHHTAHQLLARPQLPGLEHSRGRQLQVHSRGASCKAQVEYVQHSQVVIVSQLITISNCLYTAASTSAKQEEGISKCTAGIPATKQQLHKGL
eukprot:GHRR01006304.1.p1 GENE.GHRR01006304.1~~GHRR01006304.1.p1  ORF type:complete len:169 (-),score=44.31 GHRR01006304.1:367-873(-)